MTIRSRHVRRAGTVILLALLATCTPPEATVVVPIPETASPQLRIGLVIGAPRAEISGDSGLLITDGGGAPLGEITPGAAWTVRLDGALLSIGIAGGGRIGGQPTLRLAALRPAGLVGVNGRLYHGSLTIQRDRTGLTILNTVGLEEYLPGVVSAEMGRRDALEAEALTAQAIISRTFAIRNLGKRAGQGFDLYATVVDQVYGGVTSEYPIALDAVRNTKGLILTWQGAPIDAFFFSTCGGRTADGTEVFAAADRPYLRSIHDTDPSGQAWCRNSPRFRWREEWSGDQLRAVLRTTLPTATGTTAEAAAGASGVSITGRTGSDRVARIAVRLQQGSVEVSGPAVRQVLRPPAETMLRSATFQLTETVANGRLTKLVAEGNGAGHGVGYCQWGAIGRARGGQDARTILSAYFPGTTLSRAY